MYRDSWDNPHSRPHSQYYVDDASIGSVYWKSAVLQAKHAFSHELSIACVRARHPKMHTLPPYHPSTNKKRAK